MGVFYLKNVLKNIINKNRQLLFSTFCMQFLLSIIRKGLCIGVGANDSWKFDISTSKLHWDLYRTGKMAGEHNFNFNSLKSMDVVNIPCSNF